MKLLAGFDLLRDKADAVFTEGVRQAPALVGRRLQRGFRDARICLDALVLPGRQKNHTPKRVLLERVCRG